VAPSDLDLHRSSIDGAPGGWVVGSYPLIFIRQASGGWRLFDLGFEDSTRAWMRRNFDGGAVRFRTLRDGYRAALAALETDPLTETFPMAPARRVQAGRHVTKDGHWLLKRVGRGRWHQIPLSDKAIARHGEGTILLDAGTLRTALEGAALSSIRLDEELPQIPDPPAPA